MSTLAAVVVVGWNHSEDLKVLIPQLMCQNLSDYVVILSDNGSVDDTIRWVEENHGDVVVLRNGRNIGFSGGCNAGIRVALRLGIPYIALLNPDCRVGPAWLEELVRTAERDESIGICQSKIYLHPASDPPIINTVGNEIHYTGIGMCGHLGEPDVGAFDDDGEIAYACGAAMLVRAEAIRKIGMFDEDMFAYHEDFDLGVRAWIAGYRVVRSHKSIAYHRYRFRRDRRRDRHKFYLVDRNRLYSLIKTYQLRTLIALAPALLVMEAGMLFHAIGNGWFGLKLRTYCDVVGSLKRLLVERGRIQSGRSCGDEILLARTSRRIVLPDGTSARALRIANSVFELYLRLISRLLSDGRSHLRCRKNEGCTRRRPEAGCDSVLS